MSIATSTTPAAIILAVLATAITSAQAASQVRIDVPQVRVLETTAEPRQRGTPRERPMDRVLVFRDAGRLTRIAAGKVETWDVRAGEMRWDPAGAPYVIENATERAVRIVEIELRNTPNAPPLVLPPLDPPLADSAHYTVELENERVRVLRVRYEPHTTGGLHEHVRDRVVVNLSPELIARYGGVRMAGAATHSEENTTDQPQERLAVELK